MSNCVAVNKKTNSKSGNDKLYSGKFFHGVKNTLRDDGVQQIKQVNTYIGKWKKKQKNMVKYHKLLGKIGNKMCEK